ncbi:unnamed protein product [Didymodactylos carnosus]|uniref:ADP ribosyltransferase domain-containing protein n=1 Tax=Didymodactylos carnosus TaxID=1234261 RepID=A0A8S2TNG1_9BILA|nr:unnamed protein product [Didymodactylos carnosus]CAF4298947.1 unnamed protein product [Didymodactylos carnosus]
MQHTPLAKQEMLDKCQKHYNKDPSKLKRIQEFADTYKKEEAIKWFTKDSFIYRLLNRALRTEDINALYIFRFYISDLCSSLEERCELTKEFINVGKVYRGLQLRQEQIDKLKTSIGSLISLYGFVSTSTIKELALIYAGTDCKDLVPVIFEIDLDAKTDQTIFAYIAYESNFPEEEEILIDIGTGFRIKEVALDKGVWTVSLAATNEGREIVNGYLALPQSEVAEIGTTILFGRLLADMGKYQKSQGYFEGLLKTPDGENVANIYYNIGRALYLNGKYDDALTYYIRAYEQSHHPQSAIQAARILNGIGNVYYSCNEYDKARKHHLRSLKIRQKMHLTDHHDVAESLNDLAGTYSSLNNHKMAEKYYSEAFNMYQRTLPANHHRIGECYNTNGVILQEKGEYDKALVAYTNAHKLRKRVLPLNHPDFADNLLNIGMIYYHQNDYDTAEKYYKDALVIQERELPSDHPALARTMHEIGVIYYRQDNYMQAFNYHVKAMNIFYKMLPANRLNFARSLHEIGTVSYELNDYQMAFDCYKQALNIKKKILSNKHYDFGRTLNNMGALYHALGEKSEAFKCYSKALRIFQQTLVSDHADILSVRSNTDKLRSRAERLIDLFRGV